VFLRNLGGLPKHGSDESIVALGEVIQCRDVTAWDEKDVHRCLWIDILERDEFLILVDELRRNLARDDPAK